MTAKLTDVERRLFPTVPFGELRVDRRGTATGGSSSSVWCRCSPIPGTRESPRSATLSWARPVKTCPAPNSLDAALLVHRQGKASARSTVRLTELFDRLVWYRNAEIGHRAAGHWPRVHTGVAGWNAIGIIRASINRGRQ